MKSLREQNIETSPKVFTIKQDDICDTEIIQIIDANLKILNKLSSEDVKSIQTVELKRWCSSIEKGEAGNYRNKSILKELKEYINKLPKEITKDNNDENYVYLFNKLNKIGSN
jgi:transcription initiation factor TFIIIB Brf1 subunit/transcription initiation factor TFIIB